MRVHEELTPRPSQALVWQVVDSAFPIGGFAHSLGLEAAVHAGDVRDRDTLSRFVRSALLQVGYGVLPLVTAAVRQPERLAELDALADAFLTNPVVNRASRVQGRTLVATCVRVWPSQATRAVQSSMAALAGHAAPLTGVAFRTIGLPLWTIQEIVLFAVARGVLSAAVRLGVIGSYDAQRLQHESSVQQAFVLARCSDLDLDHLAQPAPILDLVHASHDRLYSRLFQS
jgi:urease accessory protein